MIGCGVSERKGFDEMGSDISGRKKGEAAQGLRKFATKFWTEISMKDGRETQGEVSIVRTFLAWGLILLLALVAVRARGADRTLSVGGVPVTMQDLSGDVDILYSAMRFNRAINAWNVEVTIRNKGARQLSGPFALYVESYSGTTGLLQPDAMDGTHAYFELGNYVTNALLAPQQSSAARTLTLGNSGGTPQVTARVYGNPQAAGGYALALSRSLNETGQPLPEVGVEEIGPEGGRTNVTDSALGLVTLGQRDGTHVWKFARPGYLSVWRRSVLHSNQVAVIANPRLTARSTNMAVFTPIAGGTLSTAGIQITFGPGVFAQNTTGTVTRLTGQTLPAFLPLGWSPLQAFSVELDRIPSAPGTMRVTPWGRVAAAETAALVQWNELTLGWDVREVVNGETNLTFALPGAGSYSVVVGDAGTYAPPAAQAGQALEGTAAPFDFPTGLTALGTVTPSLSPASRNPELVTASAEVTITNVDGPMPSGVVLRCDVSETYDLADDTRRVLPRYETFIVAYQRPGDANPNTLVATFPVRPMLLLGGDELKQGVVQVDVIQPTSFGGGVFDAKGGQVAAGGVRILAAAGVFTNRLALDLRLLDKTNFVGLAGSNIVHAFELSLGELAPGKRLNPQFTPQTPNSFYVLARVLSRSGLSGLEPVERFTSDGNGKLTSVDTNASGLTGLTSGGQFVLMRMAAPQGLVQGTAKNVQQQAIAGIPVRITGQPWLTFTREAGAYRLISPTGSVQAVVMDLNTGDSTGASTLLANWQAGVTLNVTATAAGPRVIAVTPANGATNVTLVASVTLTFSEPINVGSAVGAMVLLDGSNQPVNASLSFNLKGTVATLLPTDALTGNTMYRVWLATNITDLAGYPLEGSNVFVFKTQTEVADHGLGAQLVSHEPTNGVVWMAGSQGIAESKSTVILVNETSGQTTTVIANSDGSFEGTIRASVDDRLSAVFVNANGTRNTIPVSKQIFRDGRVGLFAAGGTIEVATPDGPAKLIVEANAIPNRTILKVDYIAPTNFPTNVVVQPPNGGKLYGALHVIASGDEMRESMDVEMPVKLEDLGLPPGEDPTNSSFALVMAHQMTDIDGENKTVYEIIDRMHYENGKLVTHSPPFAGLLAAASVGWDLIVYASLQGTGGQMGVAGRVFAAVVEPDGRVRNETKRYLPGALVNVVPPNSALPGLPGRLRPGSMFAYANGTNAQYAAVVPVFQSGSTILQARHPAFPGQVATLAVPTLTPNERFIVGNMLFPMDIIFHLDPSSQWDVKAPTVSFAHSPQLPGVGTNDAATLRVVAVDNLSRPSLQTEVEQVIPFFPTNISTSGVRMTLLTNEEAGALSRRMTYEVKCPVPARVVFKSISSDDNGNDKTTFYSISFGLNIPEMSNNIPIIDPNDHRGPTVIASEPPRGARSVAPGQVIKITFNEPVDIGLLQIPGVVNIFPEASEPSLNLSEDQRELSITVYDLKPDTDYTLTLSNIKDLNNNPLDQEPAQGGNQSYTLSFHTAALPVGQLQGITYGGGVVTRGIYAYALERQGPNGTGAVKVYDLSNPTAPENVANVILPNGFPRDLLIIPHYSFKFHTNESEQAVTRDLLVVVGGLLGQGRAQYLRVIDITNPRNPTNILGWVLSLSPDSAVTRVQWAAPHLGYLDSATVPSINIVNLQAMLITDNLTPEEFRRMPADGFAGVDANGDGDYVDPGDQLPLPASVSADFAGKVAQLAFGDTDQFMRDFALEDGAGFVGVIADAGHLFGTNGMPTSEAVEACYTTLMAGGEPLERGVASYYFTNAILHRVSLLFGQNYPVEGGSEVKDLALVTLHMKQGYEEEKTNRLAVLDVTIPTDPRLMTEIPISSVHGDDIWSIVPREDGMLLLAADRDVIILDPTKFHLPMPTNAAAVHPAIAGVIPGAGDGSRTFAGTAAGFNLSSEKTKNTVSLSAPQVRLISFPGVTPFSPESLIAQGSIKVEETLHKVQFEQDLRVARFKASGNDSPSTLTPPDHSVHYYALISAPGSAGPTLDLAIESLNRSGYPLKNRGFLFPPVRAVDLRTADDLGQRPRDYEAPVRAGKAWRLSDDPASPNYNVYLSRPFAFIYEETSKDELTSLQADLDREILWSGSFVRVSLDPVMQHNDVVGPFASGFDSSERIIAPGASAIARCLPGDYIMGPNPGPILGGVAAPVALGAMGAHNGEVTMAPVDMTLPGRRLPIEFRRVSNSQGLFEGPFGRGWDFNFNQRLVELREGVFPNGARLPLVQRANAADSEVAGRADVIFHNGAGRAIAYKYYGTAAPVEVKNDPLVIQLGWLEKAARFYTSPKGVFSILLKMQDGRFVRLEPDGMQYWYGTDGRLERIYDRYDKNSLECRYNTRGELVQILDELDRPLDVGYWRLNGDTDYRQFIDDRTANPDIAGKISRLKDYTGRDILFFYTEEGLLQRKEGPLVTVAGEDGFLGRQVTTYFSSGTDDAVKSAQSVKGVQSGSSAGTPLLAATEIGRAGRDVATKINTAGKEVTLDMAHANTAAALSQGNGKSKFVGQDKSTTEYSFDKFGRPLEVKLGKEGETTETSSFTYNDHGLVKTITYPEGNSEEFTYDETNPSWRSRGNVLSIVKKPGPRGGPTLTAASTYDSMFNQPLSKTDYNGNLATMSLQSDRRDAETITIEGETERYHRNEFGQLEKFTAADGVTHEFHYNSQGYLEWKQTGPYRTEYFYPGKPGQLGLPSTVRDPRSLDTTFVYDERNQAVSQDRYGYRIENSYDERGFVVKIKTTQDTDLTVTEVNTYDQLGFKLKRTVQNVEVNGAVTNLVTTYEPDDSSRIKKVVMPSGETHQTTYDQAGRITKYQVGNYTETYGYDRNGNLLTNWIGDGFEVYTYDGHDRLKTVTSPNGGITEYEYDGNNNVKSLKVIDPIDGTISETTYEVDFRNRYRQVTRVGDESTAVVKYDYLPATRQMVMTDALNDVTTTTYDEAGRLKSQESPTRKVDFTYDPNGNLIKKESRENGRSYVEESGYNERNQVVWTKDSLGNEVTMAVGLDGRVVTMTDRDGHTTTNTYNSIGELTSVREPNGTVVNYTHNADREIASVTDINGNGISHTYDELGRLIRTRHADGSETVQGDFDLRNAPRTQTLPGGVNITSTFDKEGKLLTRAINGPTGSRVESYRHDVTGRLRRITDPSGSVEYAYDKLGFAKSIAVEQNGFLYTTTQKADQAGFRSEVKYPSGLKIVDKRDNTGRLTGLEPDGAPTVVGATVYASDSLVGTRILGSNVITSTMEYDLLKRPTARRYTRASDGKLLAEVRYAYTKGGAQVARQFVHRAGRTDFFGYDSNYQLTRADIGVRPKLSSETARTVSGFTVPDGLEGNWSPGAYAREFSYTTTDVLKNSTLINPDALATPPFASSYTAPDESLHVDNIDGVARTVDAVGNVTSGRLWVRLPGASAPTAVNATFEYNDLGQLVKVARADGVVIENRYGPAGLRIRRHVAGSASLCVPSDIGYVYDGGNLIEERDLADNNKLIARYYYGDDGDELVAGDLADSSGQLRRYYFLSDGLRSIMGVADASGEVVERINYDAWGQPEIQLADHASPRIAKITRDGTSLLVQFTEPVLPGFDRSFTNLVTSLADVQTLFQVRNPQGAIAGTITFVETNTPFGTTFRYSPGSSLLGSVTIVIAAGAVQDEWNNGNPAESLIIDASTPPGTPLYTGPAAGSTAPVIVARTQVGASFGFQGQVFDYDAGLSYCRARFYDPGVGFFLQRDPAGYEDSVNHYAGFKNNPVNFRDATGMATDEFGAWLQNIGSQASYKEDGLIGVAIGGALEFAGRVLQLGTATAEGLDKLEHVRPGTMGMLDIMNAAQLIAGDVAVFTSATSLGSSIGIAAKRRYGSTIKAYATSGYESARDIIAQKTGRRTGYGVASRYGFHTDETSAIHRTLLQARQMGMEPELTIRMGSDYERGCMRRRWVSQGLAQKRGVDWEGKSGRDARMISKFKDKKLVVSDLDIAGVKMDGKLANTKGYTWVEKNINREYCDRFRGKFGNTRKPNPPIQHHGQFQMSEQYGKTYLGHELGLKKMEAVGHPGHTVTFRLDAKGNLLVHRTPGWSVDIDILKTEMNLRKRMSELSDGANAFLGMGLKDQNLFFALPKTWHAWK